MMSLSLLYLARPNQTMRHLLPPPTISVSVQFPEKLAAQDTIGSKAEDAITVFSSAARSKALFCSNNPELLYEFTSASDRD
jgi:hypothetical protein